MLSKLALEEKEIKKEKENKENMKKKEEEVKKNASSLLNENVLFLLVNVVKGNLFLYSKNNIS